MDLKESLETGSRCSSAEIHERLLAPPFIVCRHANCCRCPWRGSGRRNRAGRKRPRRIRQTRRPLRPDRDSHGTLARADLPRRGTSHRGRRRSVELSLTGREFSAAEALSYGLVTEIANESTCAGDRGFARKIAGVQPPRNQGAGLGYVHQIRGLDWEQAGRAGHQTRERLLATEDFKEGTRAFLEKRQPSWPSLKGHLDT